MFRVDIWAKRGISRSRQEVEGKRPTRLQKTEDRCSNHTVGNLKGHLETFADGSVAEPNQNMLAT